MPAPIAPPRTAPRTAVLVVLVVLMALAVASTFAPWLRSGSSERTSYQVVQAAVRLEVLDPTPQAVASAVWAFVPLVAVAALFAAVRGRVRPAAALAGGVGVVVAAFAAVVRSAPEASAWGATAGLASGLALVVAALAAAWSTRRRA
ncbi:hypothetical protein KSP35_10290 [Aquihabitans sp. G128]|uniref:hypothetical protein n=1 Tax=Aquihabitans sp. G128 TaxID=2849779 RepID=UPI001C24E8EA|nr:hypothetical protein [Aquihabitans sp. G128]QXC63130.1 hypothetical protein KSP35_10290 [Aquihabitans sp. G128]